jgi:hypothetical protein
MGVIIVCGNRLNAGIDTVTLCVPIFVVLPKHSQFVDHSILVKHYVLL